MEQWRFIDTEAASDFVQSLDPGLARDKGASHIISLASRVDPHTALEWSMTLSDPDKRLKAMISSVKSIDTFASTPGEAIETVRALDVSDGDRAALLEAQK